MATALSSWRNEIIYSVPQCPEFTIDAAVLSVLRDFCAHTRCWTATLSQIEIDAYQDTYALTSALGDIDRITRVSVNASDLISTSEADLDAYEQGWRTMTASLPERYYMGADRYIHLVYQPNEDSDVYYALTDLTFTAPDTITTAAGAFLTAGITTGVYLVVDGTTYNNRTFTVEAVSETSITVEGGVTSEGTADASATFGVNTLSVTAVLLPLTTATTVQDFLYSDYMDAITYGAKAKLMAMMGTPWANPQLALQFNSMYLNERSKAWRDRRYGRTTAISRGMRG